MAMIRTQIYFTKELYRDLKTGAAINNTTVSDYIRQLLDDKSAINQLASKQNKPGNPLLELAKINPKRSASEKKLNISGKVDDYLPVNLR